MHLRLVANCQDRSGNVFLGSPEVIDSISAWPAAVNLWLTVLEVGANVLVWKDYQHHLYVVVGLLKREYDSPISVWFGYNHPQSSFVALQLDVVYPHLVIPENLAKKSYGKNWTVPRVTAAELISKWKNLLNPPVAPTFQKKPTPVKSAVAALPKASPPTAVPALPKASPPKATGRAPATAAKPAALVLTNVPVDSERKFLALATMKKGSTLGGALLGEDKAGRRAYTHAKNDAGKVVVSGLGDGVEASGFHSS